MLTDRLNASRLHSPIRIEGYHAALGEHGIPFDPSLIHAITIDYDTMLASSTREVHTRVLPQLQYKRRHGRHPPTALFALNDPLALATFKVLWKAGIHVPHDLSIVGFSGWHMADYLPISLQTWVQPTKDYMLAIMTLASCIIHSRPYPMTLTLPTPHPDGTHGLATAVAPMTYEIPGYLQTGQSVARFETHGRTRPHQS